MSVPGSRPRRTARGPARLVTTLAIRAVAARRGRILTLAAALVVPLLLAAPTALRAQQDPAVRPALLLDDQEASDVARLMRTMRRDGRPQEALDVESLQEPMVQSDARVVGEKAQCLMDLGRWSKARQLLAAYPMDPDSVVVPMAVGLMRIEMRRGEYETVRESVDRAQLSVPNNLDLRVLDIQLMLTEDRIPEAGRAIDALPEEVRDDLIADLRVDLLLARAMELMGDDDLLDRAQPMLEQAYELRPERGDVRALYVRFLARWQRYDEAEQIAKEGLEGATADEDRVVLLHALGTLYRASQRDAEARQAFSDVLEIYPNHIDAQIGLARARNRDGDRAGAFVLLQKCLDRRPDNLEALLAVAEIESGDEKWHSAEAMLNRVLEIKPNHLKALWMKSRVLARQGRMDEMEAVLEKYEARKAVLAER